MDPDFALQKDSAYLYTIGKHPEFESCNTLFYLFFGKGCLMHQDSLVFEVATGSYRLPKLFAEMAQDDKSRLWCKWQQSRWTHLHLYERFSCRYAVYRTPYYQMSAVLDYDYKGESHYALHTTCVGFPDNISIFWTSPWTINETNGARPSYWSGLASIPRSFQEKMLLA